MLGQIITIGSASFVASRIFKCMGKKEYAEILVLCGWVGAGIVFFSGLNGLTDIIVDSKFAGFIAGFIKWIIKIASYK